MRPLCLMLSASSLSLPSSNVRRGLVVDSWIVSMARNWNALLSCMAALLERLHCVGCCEADALSHPLRGGKALGAWVPLLLKGFGEALQSQVVVPHLGESLMLLVQADEVNVVVEDDIAAPLLHAYIVVPVIESVQVWSVRESKLETHLRVAHEVAILFAVVTDRDCR